MCFQRSGGTSYFGSSSLFYEEFSWGDFIMESGSTNAITWVSNRKGFPWKLQFIFNEIRILSTSINVVFHHMLRSANSMVDASAKQGFDRVSPWKDVIL